MKIEKSRRVVESRPRCVWTLIRVKGHQIQSWKTEFKVSPPIGSLNVIHPGLVLVVGLNRDVAGCVGVGVGGGGRNPPQL